MLRSIGFALALSSLLSLSSAALAQSPETPPEAVPAPPPPAPPLPPASPLPPTAASIEASPPAESGTHFELDAKISTGLVGLYGLIPQLVLGFNVGRLSVGLGVGFARFATGETYSDGTKHDSALTLYTGAPTFTYDLARSTDQRAALYLLGAIIVGGISNSSSGSTCNPTNLVFGYQAALGARYAFNPQFKLGVEAGPSGQFASYSGGCSSSTSSSDTNSSSVGLTSFYGALVATFVTR